MNILHINKYYSPWLGGVERIVEDLSKNLQADHNVTTLVCQAPGKETTHDIIDDVKVIRAKTLVTLLRLPISFDFFRLFRQHATSADLVLLHHPFPLGFLAYSLLGKKKPLVIFYHADIVKQKRTAALLSFLFKSVLRKATSIIVTSNEVKTRSTLLKGVQDRCIVIPLWINELEYKNTQVSQTPLFTQRDSSIPLLLSVGRLVTYKGYEVLLEAMKSVHNAQLLIIGEGPQQTLLETLIKQNQLQNTVFLHPSVPHLTQYYYGSDIFLLPSTTTAEAFGLTQLEAMYCGLPVINTSLPTAVPTISLNKKTGLTVKPGNSIELAQAIQTLVDDIPLRKKYGKAAYERARTHFSKQRSLTLLEKTLHQSLERTSPVKTT